MAAQIWYISYLVAPPLRQYSIVEGSEADRDAFMRNLDRQGFTGIRWRLHGAALCGEVAAGMSP